MIKAGQAVIQHKTELIVGPTNGFLRIFEYETSITEYSAREFAEVRTVVLDKTGTLTTGKSAPPAPLSTAGRFTSSMTRWPISMKKHDVWAREHFRARDVKSTKR